MPKYLKFQPVSLPNNGDWDHYMVQEKAEFDRVNRFAIENDTRVGRTFKIQTADSYAYYQVTGATKHTYKYVSLEVGDCWTDRILGRSGTIGKAVIDELIDQEEALRRIFAKAGK